jgi:hypothetical protein
MLLCLPMSICYAKSSNRGCAVMKFNSAKVSSVFAIIVSLGLVMYLVNNEPQQTKNLSTDSAEKQQVTDSRNNNVSEKQTRDQNKGNLGPSGNLEVTENKSFNNTDPFEFIFTPSAPSLWPLNQHYEQIEIKRRNHFNALAIDFKRDLIANLFLGEKLNLYIPQTQRSLTITLISIQQGKYSESRIARVDGNEDLYSAYFTLGETSLYGSIETPEGTFHIEKRNSDDALIYAASEIRKNLDYSVSDAVSVSKLTGNLQ